MGLEISEGWREIKMTGKGGEKEENGKGYLLYHGPTKIILRRKIETR